MVRQLKIEQRPETLRTATYPNEEMSQDSFDAPVTAVRLSPEPEQDLNDLRSAHLEAFTPQARAARTALRAHLEELLERRAASFIFKAPAGAGKSAALFYCLKVLKRKEEQADISTPHPGTSALHDRAPSLPHTLCLVPSERFVKGYREHLGPAPSIHILTLEELAWEMVAPFKRAVLKYVTAPDWKLSGQLTENDGSTIVSVAFGKQLPALKNGTLHLSFYEVKKLLLLFLTDPLYKRKLGWFFKQRYATVLIDEYQTFPADILNALLALLLKDQGQKQEIFWGLFGDPWQYVELKRNASHALDDPRLLPITFDYNLRSAPAIVNALNMLRPESPQVSALRAQQGSIIFVSCSDYTGPREHTPNSRGAMPEAEIHQCLPEVERLFSMAIGSDNYALFMLTRTQIAKTMGFKHLHQRLKDQGLLSDPSPHILLTFCYEFLEPLYRALKPFDARAFFSLLEPERLPVTTRADKKAWQRFYTGLTELRQNATALDVLYFVQDCDLFALPPYLLELMEEALFFDDDHPDANLDDHSIPTHLVPFMCQYSELLAYFGAFDPFSYVHSEFTVQGDSYDNVLIVIDDVWNLFNYNQTLNAASKNKKNATFMRTLHLFYSSISRTRHNLCIFDTGEFNPDFEDFCKDHLAPDLLCSYPEFAERLEELRQRQLAEGKASANSLITTASLEEASALSSLGKSH